MLLRKHLLGAVIKGVDQHRFDRIVEITLEKRGRVILELFSRGNLIVVDEKGAIVTILESQEWKDRTLKAGQPYKYPPETPDIRGIPFGDFLTILSAPKDIVKIMAADLGLGADYAKEVLARAGIDPNSRSTKESGEKAYAELKRMLESETKANIVLDGMAIDVVPFEMESYKVYEKLAKTDFNSAVDEYFTGLRAEGKKGNATRDYEKELGRIDVMVEKQKEAIASMKKDAEMFKENGDMIYARFQDIDAILQGIKQAKLEGKNWMRFLTEKGIKVTNPEERKFEFGGMEISIDHSVAENASYYYEKSKRSRSRLEGARVALGESEAEHERISQKKSRFEQHLASGPVEKRKAEWYEKFRWFVSSDGFLVIGGKDAGTNEVLIKKHTEPSDIVLHSTVRGAPFFIIKNPDKKAIPETTKGEAAEAAASYSSAWMDELGSADVYAVRPDQVSKTPNSGEYLTRGAFVIRGERELFKGVPLKVAVGFIVEDAQVEVVGGPESAVRSKTKHYVNVGVGNMKSAELTEEIKANILRRTNKEDGQRIKKVSLGEIQKWIPSGKGMVLK
jgi:predicted ribosome quality control (RQC) complex YloA/Tae2 family protein